MIFKYLFLFGIALNAHASFYEKSATYYHLHPSELQKAIESCAEHASAGMSCQELRSVAAHINELAYSLRMNPQGYGQTILQLQQTIADQMEAQTKAASPELNAKLAANQQNLRERLAIIQWLESPGS